MLSNNWLVKGKLRLFASPGPQGEGRFDLVSEVPVPRELPLGRREQGVQIHVWEDPTGRGCHADPISDSSLPCRLCVKLGLPGREVGSTVLEWDLGAVYSFFVTQVPPTSTSFLGFTERLGIELRSVHKPPSSAAQFSHTAEEVGNSRSFRVREDPRGQVSQQVGDTFAFRWAAFMTTQWGSKLHQVTGGKLPLGPFPLGPQWQRERLLSAYSWKWIFAASQCNFRNTASFLFAARDLFEKVIWITHAS